MSALVAPLGQRWTEAERAAAEEFIAQRRALLQTRQSVTLEVRIRAGDHDQWFQVNKERLRTEAIAPAFAQGVSSQRIR